MNYKHTRVFVLICVLGKKWKISKRNNKTKQKTQNKRLKLHIYCVKWTNLNWNWLLLVVFVFSRHKRIVFVLFCFRIEIDKMVNIPINVSAFPTDEIGVVTDINQNINQEYYEWLLKQHNYFPDCAFHKVSYTLHQLCIFAFTFSRYSFFSACPHQYICYA